MTEIAWKATIVLAAAFAANYALRRGSAAVRHFVWTAAFAVLLAMPIVVAMGPKWSAATPAVPSPAKATVVTATPSMVIHAAPAPVRRVPWEFLYLAGALLVAGRFAVGIWATLKMVRGADAATHATELVERLRCALRIRRPVRALESAGAQVPMTWGILRPVALLPEGASEWPADRLHTVLLHELVHVQRHDLLAQTLGQAACCLFWFHPLAWLAARELRKERERACDDAVLNRGVAPADYAGHLMEMVRSVAARRASLADAPAMAETSDLESRVRALLDGGRNRAPLTRRVAMTVAALTCALALPVATWTTHAQSGRGALAGIVSDPSGARVPKATVIVKNLDGNNQETTQANEAGEYVFASIPPGRYAIETRMPGFKAGKQEGVVTAGTATRSDVNLELGGMSETVTVRAARTSPPPAMPQRTGAPQRIPVGGSVQIARLVRQPRPVYPEALKQQGVTGVVMIKTVVSKEGETVNPQVVNTDVHPDMAQAALDAVRQWRYTPTLLNGQPVETVTTVEIRFELDQ